MSCWHRSSLCLSLASCLFNVDTHNRFQHLSAASLNLSKKTGQQRFRDGHLERQDSKDFTYLFISHFIKKKEKRGEVTYYQGCLIRCLLEKALNSVFIRGNVLPMCWVASFCHFESWYLSMLTSCSDITSKRMPCLSVRCVHVSSSCLFPDGVHWREPAVLRSRFGAQRTVSIFFSFWPPSFGTKYQVLLLHPTALRTICLCPALAVSQGRDDIQALRRTSDPRHELLRSEPGLLPLVQTVCDY